MTHDYKGRRDFRAGRVAFIGAVIATLLFLSGAVTTFRDRVWHWVSIGLIVATALGVGAIAESLVLRASSRMIR